MVSPKEIKDFQTLVWDFYKKNKRSFPWRETTDPYNILVSEIMLQQTQADRVVRFYERWLKKFPNVTTLAKAPFSEIYPYWQGLGYNRRGMALKKIAEKSVTQYGGTFPKEVEKLEEFPGIGPYTARAVSIFSFNNSVACIETNIRRVYIHHFFADKTDIEDIQILEIAQRALPADEAREWHYALMDYGAYLKGQIPNPNKRHKNYSVQSKFEGSLRQIRGGALRMLSGVSMTEKELVSRLEKLTQQETKRINGVLEALEKEGLIRYNLEHKTYSLN